MKKKYTEPNVAPNKKVSKAFKLSLMGENASLQFVGSIYGKVFHNIGKILMIYIFLIDIQKMFLHQSDRYQSQDTTIDLTKFNNLEIENTNFMPYLQILKWKSFDSKQFDIFEDGSETNIKMSKLSEYLQIIIHVVDWNQEYFANINRSFKKCTYQDFEKRGLSQYDMNSIINLDSLICPDMEDVPHNRYVLRNTFAMQQDQSQISIQYTPCVNQTTTDPSTNNICKSQAEIRSFIDHIYFNLYFLQENVELENIDNYGQRPVKTYSALQSEFQLSYDASKWKYFDVNWNTVKTKDDRFSIFSTFEEFSYINTRSVQEYISQSYIQSYFNVTSDGRNQTIDNYDVQLFSAQYINLGNLRKSSTRQAYTIFHAVSKIGGIRTMVLLLVGYFTTQMNYNILVSEFIMKLFYPNLTNKKRKKQKKYRNRNDFEFSFWDVCNKVWWVRLFKPCLQKNNIDHSRFYQNLKTSIEDQINMINVVTRLQKLTIIVTTLINANRNEELKTRSEKEYLQYLSKIHGEENHTQKNVLYNYLDNFGSDINKKFDEQLIFLSNQMNLTQKEQEKTYVKLDENIENLHLKKEQIQQNIEMQLANNLDNNEIKEQKETQSLKQESTNNVKGKEETQNLNQEITNNVEENEETKNLSQKELKKNDKIIDDNENEDEKNTKGGVFNLFGYT